MKTAGVLLAAMGAAGLIAASKPPTLVKGVSYRVRSQTQMPNMGGRGGDEGGRGGGGGGGGAGQLVRVDLAGNRAKVEYQVGAPGGMSLSDFYLMILDSNKVYRVSPDSQTYADAFLGGMGMFGGGRGRGGGGPGGGGGAGGAAGAAGAAGRAGRGGGGGGGGDNPGRGGRGGGNLNPMQVINDLVVTSMKVRTEDLGAGDVIETRPTRRYLITAEYEFKLYGQPRTAKTTTEVLAIDFPHKIVDPFEGSSVAGDSLSYAGISARLVAEQKKIPGVHVQTVTTQTIPLSVMGDAEADVTAAGQVAQTVSIVRRVTVTALKEAEVDEALLSIPAGYRKIAGFGRGGGQ